ncbi:hypothetical protein [Actinomadura chokoriensis]|uniref:hypothetical protein n=1 Tax=Actinomadura chokoriensis TaxID=454156 RepID=UPI0031F8333E
MRTTARGGIALAAAGVAASGFALLGGGTAYAAPTTGHAAVAKTCAYKVVTRGRNLNVRTGPSVKFRVVGTVKDGQHVTADCKAKPTSWTRLRGGVAKNLVGKWVDGAYLSPIKPSGGADTGGGGMSAQVTGPMLATTGAGLGAIALGGGIALTARRRRSEGQS